MVDAQRGLIARTLAHVRKDGGHMAVEALVNFVLPFVIFNYAERPLGDVRALLASSVPPILWSLVEFARHRRIDALSMLVVSGIALSLLAMVGGGGVRFLQLREKLVTGVIGLVFVGSAVVGKPLVHELVRASSPGARNATEVSATGGKRTLRPADCGCWRLAQSWRRSSELPTEC